MHKFSIKKRSDFTKVMNEGTKLFSRSFVLFLLPSSQFSLGIIASKRSIGNAVQRNLAKRRIREIVRLHPIMSTPFSAVFICRKSILSIKFSELQRELESTLEKHLKS